MFYYMYKITNKVNGKMYIGVHKTKKLDDGYMGSGLLIQKAIKKYGKENFEKEILEFFDSQKEMYEREHEVVNEEIVKDLRFYNLCQGGTGFCSEDVKDMCIVQDENGNRFKVSIDDPRYLSYELKSMNHGYAVVKDKDGNNFKISINDKRYLDGEFVGATIGMVSVKDKDGNNSMVSIDDPRYLSGELKHNWAGLISVKDSEGCCFQVSKDDPRYLSGELKGVMFGMVTVNDKDGNRLVVSTDDPRYLSGELVSFVKGTVVLKDIKTGKNGVYSVDDPRRESGELVSPYKGKIIGIDENGTQKWDFPDSPDFISKKLIPLNRRFHTEETKQILSERMNGKKNHMWGKKWIHNDELDLNKNVKECDLAEYLISGWKMGRLKDRKKTDLSNKKYVTDGTTNKMVTIDELEEYLNNGWYIGKTLRRK